MHWTTSISIYLYAVGYAGDTAQSTYSQRRRMADMSAIQPAETYRGENRGNRQCASSSLQHQIL